MTQRLSQQVLKKGQKKFAPPGSGSNPFASRGEDVASALPRPGRSLPEWRGEKGGHLSMEMVYLFTSLGVMLQGKMPVDSVDEYIFLRSN